MAAYEIVERDEAGVVTRRYVGDGVGRRVDVFVSCTLYYMFHGVRARAGWLVLID
jgi:hypothetical protein